MNRAPVHPSFVRSTSEGGPRLFKRLWAWLSRGVFCSDRPTAPRVGLARAPRAPDWTPEHEGALRLFLSTDAGYTLIERMRAVVAHRLSDAGEDTMHTAHSVGRAKGFEDALRWLESLSRSSSRPNDESQLAGQGRQDVQEPGEVPLHEYSSS